MRLATVEQSREIENLSQIGPEALMEAAASFAAQEIKQNFLPELRNGSVSFFCGTGHNGADGLAVARHLLALGFKNIFIYVLHGQKNSELFELQKARLKKGGFAVSIQSLPSVNEQASEKFLQQIKANCTLLVDALSGTGLRAPLQSHLKEAIEFLNRTRLPIVSLDNPTGLDCERGVSLSACIRAQMTLSFGLAKPGFFVNEGPGRTGRLRVLPIGIAPSVFKKVALTHAAISLKQVQKFLPQRKFDANKSSSGHALICAGHEGFWGAALLSTQAAFRSGSGYVTLASWQRPAVEIIAQEPAVMTQSIKSAFEKIEKYKSIAIGPGLGTDSQNEKDFLHLLQKLKAKKFKNVVLDADALTLCAKNPQVFPLPRSWILTPHAGELERLLQALKVNISSDEIESDRYHWANEASKKMGAFVLLKGFRTIVSNGKKSYVILSGHPVLAKAGTGDVLTGFIAGFLAQGLSPLRAACVGAFVHGRLGQEWVKSGRDELSLVSSDLSELLPALLKRMRDEVVL